MRYNVFDLYEGSVRGDKLKEVALKLDYAKPAKGQGANGKNEDIDEAKLLSGLNPSILSLLKFEVKFKNMDNAPISELIQDVNFKNAIFNVAVNAARLEKLFGELKQLHFKEEEIKEAILELKELIEKEKQTEKERTQQDIALRQQIEAQNQDLQRMMNEYMKQRAEKIRALEDTIKELNAKQKELIAYDKALVKEYSELYATKLDSVVNKDGEVILRNMSPEQKQIYSKNILEDFYKIDKKYDSKTERNEQRIAEIDSQIAGLQNGNEKSGFNKNSGTISTAFQLHAGRNGATPEISELKKVRQQLVKENIELESQRKNEKSEAVVKHAKAGGVELTSEEVDVLREDASNDSKNKELFVLQDSVREEMKVVAEKVKDLRVESNNLTNDSQVDNKFISEQISSLQENLDNLESLSSSLEDDVDIDFGEDIDLSGLEEGLNESIDISSEILSQLDEPSASMRTKLN